HLQEVQIAVRVTDDDEGRAERTVRFRRAAVDIDIEERRFAIDLRDRRGSAIAVPVAGGENLEAALDARRRSEPTLERAALRVGGRIGQHERRGERREEGVPRHRSPPVECVAEYLARRAAFSNADARN